MSGKYCIIATRTEDVPPESKYAIGGSANLSMSKAAVEPKIIPMPPSLARKVCNAQNAVAEFTQNSVQCLQLQNYEH
jgi:hypothetical protein